MNEWPIFSRKEVIVGNPEANIGVCTLWTPRKMFAEEINDLMDKVSVVGNLYSVYGLGFLIRNYLANPKLRYLLVLGSDLGGSKNALKLLGSDKSLPEKLYLEEDHVSRFLKQVKIIFTVGKGARSIISNGYLENEQKNDEDFQPIIVPLPEPKASFLPSAKSGHLVRVRTIEEGYRKLLGEIRRFGHITNQDSEGQRRQELWQLNMVITNQSSCGFDSVPHPEYSPEQIKKYCEDFWEGTEPKDVSYRYGHIIRYAYGDQINAIIEAFKKKKETFRTIISLWDPHTINGSINADDPPCLTLLHLRLVNKNLHLWAYIRTNDMFNGWPLNAIMLKYFHYNLSGLLSIKIGMPELQCGELGITSGSAHIYERDWLKVDDFLNNEKSEKFYPDPKGNFEVKVEDRMIKVNHYSPKGEQLLQVFTGTTARELSRKIEPFISQTSNALYIGRELQKAEMEVENAGKHNCNC